MPAPFNLGSKKLYDYDKGRRGVFIYKHEVKPRELPDHIEKGYRIEFVPIVDMFKSTINYSKLWTSFRGDSVDKVSVTTDEIYSENAVHHIELDWHQEYEGVPEKGVVLLQNAQQESKLREKVENKTEAKIEMMEKKLSGEMKEKAIEKAKNMAQQGSKRAASDKKETQRRRDRNKKDRKRKKNNNKSGRGRSRSDD